MTTLHTTFAGSDLPFATPALASARGLALVRASGDLWRVIDTAGRVRGHLQVLPHPLGVRYGARLYHPATGRLRAVGDFWSADEAVDCLRAL